MAHYVIYHQDSDGRFAGYCAWKWYKTNHPNDEVKLFETQYGKPLPFIIGQLTKEDTIHILDFSYPAVQLATMAGLVKELVVLDHHKSAYEELKDASAMIADRAPDCKRYIHFDIEKSGALLAWEYFFPDLIVPECCALVNDRDLWKFEYGDESHAFESYLRTTGDGKRMEWWESVVADPAAMEVAKVQGRAWFDYETRLIKKFARSKVNRNIVELHCGSKVYRGVFYEGMGILHSEVAQEFYNDEELDIDFTLEHRRKDDNTVVFSLRSKRIDVSRLAKVFGGGGHAAASGFSMGDKDGYGFVTYLHTHKCLWITPMDLTPPPAED